MSQTIVVLCLNGRRRTIKFATNSTISQILEDVCLKENIDPMQYDLRSVKAVIDRTLSWNQTNLPNNAKLELCARDTENQLTPVPVKIALQLPNGQRLTDEFLTTHLLSEVVNHFLTQLKSSLNPSSDDVPEIVYMRQKFTGYKVLSCTTLLKVGIIKGSALLRISFQPPSAVVEPMETKHFEQSSTSFKPALNTQITNDSIKTALVPTEPMEEPTAENPSEIDGPTAELSTTSVANSSQVNTEPPSITLTCPSKKKISPKAAKVKRKMSKNVNNPPKRGRKSSSKSQSESKSSKKNSVDTTTSKRSKPQKPQTSPSEDPPHNLQHFSFPKETKGTNVYRNLSPSLSPVSARDVRVKACTRKPMLFNEAGRNASLVNGSSVNESDDDFFEVTVDDLRKMMSDLTHERKKLEEQEMLTDEQRRLKRIELARKYPHIVIRIILPDRLVLQGLFKPLEKINKLYEFVHQHVTVKSFYLFTTPPKQILTNKEASLFENNLAPAARVYFGTNEHFTNEQLINKSTIELSTVEDANKEIISLKNEATASGSRN